ncbi:MULTISPECIES: peptidoglycan-binding domain-containing protein [unclassified Streptomyces]|uniref:C40 family peptidase n=1 Tax=unclassified Streptomyces TaxID=2593676 RepID=UPI0011C7808B|nr:MULTISPECIES: peptidoglycan-binding protein [unclassified Streptomyces]TXS09014.1 peptidoglycan-binding protein [Streptomyces sp. wa22]WSR06772.1 peptidoglycan-binding protein [Streptomyces sp. NBC_01208]
MSLRSQLTRRTRLALMGVAAGGVASAIAVTSIAISDSSDPVTVAAGQETDYGPEPEADSALVTQAGEFSTMATATLSRDTMINRARTWLTADKGGPVPYNMERNWKDGYRQDCSGFVSMALGLGKPGLNTVGLADSRNGVTKRLSSVSQLKKGDLLIDYSTTDGDFRHVVIFEKWVNASHSAYWAYEQRGTYGTTHRQLRYGIGSDNYDPFRPVKLGGGGGGGQLPSPSVSWPVLKSGSRGADVRSAQRLLAAGGHKVEADGVFGTKTRSAVITFQRSRSLAADGVIGPNTWSKLIRTVRSGSTGQAVKAAQTQLNVYGYGLALDGSYGSKTKSAVVAFQKKHHLKVDGVVGPETWRVLLGTR